MRFTTTQHWVPTSYIYTTVDFDGTKRAHKTTPKREAYGWYSKGMTTVSHYCSTNRWRTSLRRIR